MNKKAYAFIDATLRTAVDRVKDQAVKNSDKGSIAFEELKNIVLARDMLAAIFIEANPIGAQEYVIEKQLH